MNRIVISEGGSVQYPMVRHATDIGWKPLTPQEALYRREGEDGMFLRGVLLGKLRQFNAWLTADAARAIVERLEAIPASIDGNRELLAWMRGERKWYDEGEKRHRAVVLIDFTPGADNELHVSTNGRSSRRLAKSNRADVIFLVNGIPVCIVEHKNPTLRDATERGHAAAPIRSGNTGTARSAQLFNVTHLLDYWYGVTWNANRRFMARWKQQPEDTYRFAVQSFFEPTVPAHLQHWILFYVEDEETRKSVLRQHQRRPSMPSLRGVRMIRVTAAWCGTRKARARHSRC